jgi:hypothetical protein
MKLIQNIRAAATGLVLLLSASQASAVSITYNVNDAVGTGTLVGSITTDGTLGTLASGSVLAWNLTMTNGTFSSTLTNGNSYLDTDTFGGSAGLNATATGLFFDFYSPYGYAGFFGHHLAHGIVCMVGSSYSCGFVDVTSAFSIQPNYDTSP